jgi:hypothetical protein
MLNGVMCWPSWKPVPMQMLFFIVVGEVAASARRPTGA